MIRMELNDKQKMEQFLNIYVEQDFTKGIDWLEDNWAKAKSHHLFKLMGGELILEKQIEVVKPQDVIERDIRYAFESLDRLIYSTLAKKYSKVPFELYTDITRCYYVITRSIHATGLKQEGSLIIDGKKTVLSKGQKPMKALATFIKITGIEVAQEFESFRLEHSRILNDSRLRGTLCLSIHPLDYVTVSDNDSGWESCFSIKRQGCYQAATLELLNCPSTIVAYLKSSKDMELFASFGSDATWNSKRWRQLIVAQDDVAIMANKGYPYRSDDMSKIALDWIKELAEKNCGYTYSEELFNYDDYPRIKGEREIVFATNMCYNDIESDNCAHARYYKGNGYLTTNPNNDYCLNKIRMGGEAYCLSCGSTFDDAEEMVCPGCLGLEACACCEDLERADCTQSLSNGDIVCDYCYNHNVSMCDNCGEEFIRDDMYSHNGDMLCINCYDSVEPEGNED